MATAVPIPEYLKPGRGRNPPGEFWREITYIPEEEELFDPLAGPKGRRRPETITGGIARMIRKNIADPLYKAGLITGRARRGQPPTLLEALEVAALGALPRVSGGLGSGPGVARPSGSRLIRRMSGSHKKTKEIDRGFKENIRKWLAGEVKDIPYPKEIYRGVKRGDPVREGQYSHATPWAHSAARGGKGIFGGERHTVYRAPANKDTLYYRGGSLSGDPLESTRIPNIEGMKWDEILEYAKDLYYRDLASTRLKARRSGYKLNKIDEDYIADRVIDDISNASFETDLVGKPGIWRGKPVQSELKKKMPPLRSYDEMVETAENKLIQGYPEEDIPEISILRRNIPEMKNTQDAIAFGKEATKDQIFEMSRLEPVYRNASRRFREEGDFQGAMNTAVKAQFLREAQEAAKGILE